MADLTDEERAELEQLRAEKNAAAEAQPVEVESTLPDTHWIHLANGDVFTAKGIASSVDGIPVIGTYEIPAHLQDGAKPAEAEHKF